MYWIQETISDEYHDLNITQNMSGRNIGYHSANDVVLNRGITSAQDNLEMAAKRGPEPRGQADGKNTPSDRYQQDPWIPTKTTF